ncbi:aminotransferase class V-fold PLP-dependent enzyme [Kiloniella sp. b19]|uniref:aminotransferase class V-fold PLP-dependent enzyme n=1 Tax=Kiloniella sp. GXU_MW_B19 TaxID=3141326 RepID=UPI0031E0EBE9
MALDLEVIREETRACDRLIHFNNAGSSLMPAPVSDALHEYLDHEEQYGGYETAELLSDRLENFYKASAKLLNCSPDEIAFAENATRAWDMIFYSLPLKAGDRILTCEAEYGSNVIAYLHRAESCGAEIVFIPDDENGAVDLKALEAAIDDSTALITMSHIPTGGGLVNPAAEVGKIAKKHKVPFLLDACQSVGQLPLDVEDIGCDFLTGTGRKYLRGPRGTGLLYIRRDWIDKLNPVLLDQHAATLTSRTAYTLRGDAKRFENWEKNFAGMAALGVAIDYALSLDLNSIRDRIYFLADLLRTRIKQDIPGATLTDLGLEKCGIVTFTVAGHDVDEIKTALRKEQINVSRSQGSGSLISFEARGLKKVVRASVHYYNTEDEIEAFVATLKKLTA